MQLANGLRTLNTLSQEADHPDYRVSIGRLYFPHSGGTPALCIEDRYDLNLFQATRCMGHFINAMPKWMEEEDEPAIDLKEVFSTVDEFFVEFPSAFWSTRDDDTPIRYSYP